MKEIIAGTSIERRIYMLRGRKVILSFDLAQLYGVKPKVLVQAVKRHKNRFPADFMLQLRKAEFMNLKSQFVTSNWGGLRCAMPYAFTEQGIAMLSSVLNSERAVRVNIAIMRAFVRLRQMLAANKDLACRKSPGAPSGFGREPRPSCRAAPARARPWAAWR